MLFRMKGVYFFPSSIAEKIKTPGGSCSTWRPKGMNVKKMNIMKNILGVDLEE
jgi:hypothetical protein